MRPNKFSDALRRRPASRAVRVDRVGARPPPIAPFQESAMPPVFADYEETMTSFVDDSTAVRGAGKPIEILLVEDNPGDAALTMETLQEGRIRNKITRVEDGVQAMAFLRRAAPYANAPRPDLILLDLQLPRKNGREV